MNRLCTAFAAASLVVLGAVLPARAVPPTVTPSPGYDARLQEQRKAMSPSTSIVVQPVAPPRHPSRRKH